MADQEAFINLKYAKKKKKKMGGKGMVEASGYVLYMAE